MTCPSMTFRASSLSLAEPNRTKPYPLLRPVLLSVITYREQGTFQSRLSVVASNKNESTNTSYRQQRKHLQYIFIEPWNSKDCMLVLDCAYLCRVDRLKELLEILLEQ